MNINASFRPPQEAALVAQPRGGRSLRGPATLQDFAGMMGPATGSSRPAQPSPAAADNACNDSPSVPPDPAAQPTPKGPEPSARDEATPTGTPAAPEAATESATDQSASEQEHADEAQAGTVKPEEADAVSPPSNALLSSIIAWHPNPTPTKTPLAVTQVPPPVEDQASAKTELSAAAVVTEAVTENPAGLAKATKLDPAHPLAPTHTSAPAQPSVAAETTVASSSAAATVAASSGPANKSDPLTIDNKTLANSNLSRGTDSALNQGMRPSPAESTDTRTALLPAATVEPLSRESWLPPLPTGAQLPSEQWTPMAPIASSALPTEALNGFSSSSTLPSPPTAASARMEATVLQYAKNLQESGRSWVQLDAGTGDARNAGMRLILRPGGEVEVRLFTASAAYGREVLAGWEWLSRQAQQAGVKLAQPSVYVRRMAQAPVGSSRRASSSANASSPEPFSALTP